MSSVVKKIHTDVLVVGAGLIGSSVAMGLARASSGSVLVADLDLSGEWSSSELNAGGVRATWGERVNLLTSKFSIEYFETVADQVGYRPCGYLWMHRPETFEQALKSREMHLQEGWEVQVLDPALIRKHYPFMDKTGDLAGALLGVKDGLVNPNRLKEHFREEAKAKSAQFLDRVWIYGSAPKENGAFVIKAFQFSEELSSDRKRELLVTQPKDPSSFLESEGAKIEIHAKVIVNACGAWAPTFAKMMGYLCPSKPTRRQISLFHARDLDLTPYGMMIDPSGVYFHPESIYGLSGFANRDESHGFQFHYDGDSFFEEFIWPHLAERSTQLESLKHVSGWAGLYEESPDHHAIIGASPVEGVYEAHSFSGHGVMQSYGVGVALAELILKGKYLSLDLEPLSGDRFTRGSVLKTEKWVI